MKRQNGFDYLLIFTICSFEKASYTTKFFRSFILQSLFFRYGCWCESLGSKPRVSNPPHPPPTPPTPPPPPPTPPPPHPPPPHPTPPPHPHPHPHFSGPWGLYKIWLTRPSPGLDPTWGVRIDHFQLWGWRYPSCAQTVPFFSVWMYLSNTWSNQLNQSERLIYAPLAWITTDSGNGLVSSLCQAIAWTNFDL